MVCFTTLIEKLRDARKAAEQLDEEVLLYFIDMALSEATDRLEPQRDRNIHLAPAPSRVITS